jgi:hypothetical protein
LRQWVTERLGGYVKLEIEDKFQAVHELSESGHTVQEIADITGLGKTQVSEIGQEIKGRR